VKLRSQGEGKQAASGVEVERCVSAAALSDDFDQSWDEAAVALEESSGADLVAMARDNVGEEAASSQDLRFCILWFLAFAMGLTSGKKRNGLQLRKSGAKL
jgi:hypothetical protein